MAKQKTKQHTRVAVDIGGTFTDVALELNGTLHTAKTLTTPTSPVEGVLSGIKIVCETAKCPLANIDIVIHGTTLATNALIEHKGARVGFITTRGFRDIVEIAHERRYDQYDMMLDKPDLLVKREQCWTVPERINAKGQVLEPLDTDGLDRILSEMEAQNVETVAICLLHSYLNGEHERALRVQIAERRPDLSITLSSEVCPEIREFDRACTAIANAYIKPLMGNYLTDLADALSNHGITCPLLIVTSGGGVTTLETATAFPIRLVESGPSGGAILASAIADQCGIKGALSFDMGGTTAKLCLIDNGKPQRSRQFEIARAARFMKGSGLPVRIPVVEMIEIGAGGGSIARVDSLNRLAIGPDSAGSDPGPVCYGNGGTRPTVSDSDLALGFIDPKLFAEGRVKLRPKESKAAIRNEVGKPLGLSGNAGAYGISQMVDENMANAARVHAVEHGKNIADRTMIAFGGNGPLHATRVAEKTGVTQIIIPHAPGVGSAVGFLSAPISYEIIRSLYMLLESFDPSSVAALFQDMALEARAVVSAGAGSEKLIDKRMAFMRYEGQGYEIEVELPPGPINVTMGEKLRAEFNRIYLEKFGRTVPHVDVEVINWAFMSSTQVTKHSLIPKPRKKVRAVPADVRKIYWGQDRKTLAIPQYWRENLSPGDWLEGPALITEPQTTTLVSPTFSAVIDAGGNIVMKQDTSDQDVVQ